MDALTMYNLLTAAGMTAAGASGALGNWDRESGLKGCNLQNSGNKRLRMTDEEYTAAVDNNTYTNFVHDSIGYGIVQWTYWSRKQALYNKAIACGCSIGDEVMQISFAIEELKRDYRSVWLVLTTTASVREASDIMLYMYERPADQGEAERAEREKRSRKYYEIFHEGGIGVRVMIGSARSNEKGGINGGKAGDQTGGEVSTQEWYLHKKGWILIRAKRPEVAEAIAASMDAVCANDNIGYCQDHRLTCYNSAKEVGFDCSKINNPVEVDCSEAVRINVAYAGIITPDFNTESEAKALSNTGEFQILRDAKHCCSPDYLLRGDILVTSSKGHTVVVLNDGIRAAEERTQAVGWRQDATGWWYVYDETGAYARNEWMVINHYWYLFGPDGYMLTGWQMWDSKTNSIGSGDWYYLDTTKGSTEGQCWHEKPGSPGALEPWYVE